MPMPSKDTVTALLGPVIAGQGFDLEDVSIVKAGKHSAIRLVVDSDNALELDTIAELSRAASEVLDAADITGHIGDTPYTLEVTSPGLDRPLTKPVHWRRSRARKVRVMQVDGTVFDARIGLLCDDETIVSLVLSSKNGPEIKQFALAEISEAVVQVEFSKPSVREVELAGGLIGGRVGSGELSAELDEQHVGGSCEESASDDPDGADSCGGNKAANTEEFNK
ncbi:MAG: ribosome maturation factor RimP [Mycobacteriaceae bacterium]